MILTLKKGLLLHSLIFLSFLAKAQTEKGQFMVGGNANLSTTKINNHHASTGTNTFRSFGFGLRPNVGYFFLPQFVVGLTPSFSYQKQKSGPDNSPMTPQSVSHDIGLGFFSRYYFLLGKFGVFPELSVDKQFVKSKNYQLDPIQNVIVEQEEKNNSINFYPSIGLSYFITDNVGIEGILKHSSDKEEYDTFSNDFKRLSFNIGLQVFL